MEQTKLLALFLICVVIQTPAECADCPQGFFKHKNSCYFVSRSEANWIGALRYCESFGTNLLKIENAEEQSFISTFIKRNNSVSTLTFSEPDQKSYHFLLAHDVDIRGHSAIKFKVKSCSDAHVALSRYHDEASRYVYEIVFGGWQGTKSVIRNCAQCNAEAEGISPLHCNQFTPLWVSWADGNIRAGSGERIGRQTIMSWNGSNPHDINYIAIHSGWGYTGTWTFTKATYNPGVFWIAASDLLVENEWIWLRGKDAVTFSAWAPGEPSSTDLHDNCAALDGTRELKWDDVNCEEKRNFICEKSITTT